MRWSVPASIRSDPPRDVAAPSIASASRAGHPSVSRVRRVAVSAGSRSPSSRPSPTASRSSIASSVGPISSSEPSARQRANGRRIRARPAMATCDPSGRCSTSSARMSRHAREVIRCASSMAIRTRSGGRDIAANNRPTTVRCDTVSAAIALKSSATERYAAVDRRREIGQEHDRDRCHCRRPSARRPARRLPSPTGRGGSTCRSREARRSR